MGLLKHGAEDILELLLNVYATMHLPHPEPPPALLLGLAMFSESCLDEKYMSWLHAPFWGNSCFWKEVDCVGVEFSCADGNSE